MSPQKAPTSFTKLPDVPRQTSIDHVYLNNAGAVFVVVFSFAIIHVVGKSDKGDYM